MTSYYINGKLSLASTPTDYGEGLLVNSLCFNGIVGLQTCKATNTDASTDDAFQYDLPYYYNFNKNSNGASYCVQCCGNSPVRRDTWSFKCLMDGVTAKESNVYANEFRFAKRVTSPVDVSEIVRCPIWRQGCSYASNGTVLACNKNDGRYLAGYVLTLSVREYNQNFQIWRGVDSCTVRTFETNASLSKAGYFYETIILDYNTPIEDVVLDNYRIFFLFLFCLVFVAAGLYLCRKKNCIVCQKKLLFCLTRCFYCRLLGAHADPNLIKVLAEKGAILQGTDQHKTLDFDFHELPLQLPWRGRNKVAPLSVAEVENANGRVAVISQMQHFVATVGNTIAVALQTRQQRTAEEEQELESVATRLIKEVHPAVVLKAICHPLAKNVLDKTRQDLNDMPAIREGSRESL